MLDNLRDQASSTPFTEDDDQLLGEVKPRRRRSSPGRILGMTAAQRFLIALMFSFVVCLLGVLALMITGKIWLF